MQVEARDREPMDSREDHPRSSDEAPVSPLNESNSLTESTQDRCSSAYNPLLPISPDASEFESSEERTSHEPSRDRILDEPLNQKPEHKSEPISGDAHLSPRTFVRKPRWRGWRRPLKHLGISLLLGTTELVLILAALTPGGVDDYLSNVELLSTPYRYLYLPKSCYPEPGSFVGIDAPVARLSFAGAKAIDLAWNSLVGRGVQVVLVLLSYRVFADGLMKAAEAQCVPVPTFVSLAFFPTSVASIWSLLTSLVRAPGWRIKIMVLWALLSILFLAGFPSLMDLSTGYDAFSSLSISLPGDGMHLLDDSNAGGLDSSYSAIGHAIGRLRTSYPLNLTVNRTYGSYQLYNLRWANAELQSEWDAVWNASAAELYAASEGDTPSYSQPMSEHFYLADADNYSCTVQNGVYMWGFSRSWVLITVCVTCAWLLGMWIFWVDADHNSQMSRKRRRLGTYRAILDVGDVLRGELGDELGAYSEKELRRAVDKVGRVKYRVSNVEEEGLPRVRLSTGPSQKVKLNWGTFYA